jgi:hypothetical protein
MAKMTIEFDTVEDKEEMENMYQVSYLKVQYFLNQNLTQKDV